MLSYFICTIDENIYQLRIVEHFTIFHFVILKLLYLLKWSLTKQNIIKVINCYLCQLKKYIVYILNDFSFADVLVFWFAILVTPCEVVRTIETETILIIIVIWLSCSSVPCAVCKRWSVRLPDPSSFCPNVSPS